MTLTSTDVANQAIQLMGDNQPPVTGLYPNFNNSTAGIALNFLYGTVVATIAREFSWDFARSEVSLVLSGNVAPSPWLYEYLYPSDAAQIWQLMPPTLADPNNPIPIRWSVANTIVSGVQTKIIWTNLTNAVGVINNNPKESVWDSIFTQAVIRLLASELATALAGRPDTAQMLIEIGSSFESLGETRDS
jgi:hypothetical protein